MSADNHQKTPIARTLNQFAERKVFGAMTLYGPVLPAKVISVAGSIVTVSFLINAQPYVLPGSIKVPLAGSEYVRLPIQPGCLGVVLPSEIYLGGVTGLGGGTADLKPRANLSQLIFLPLGNSNWSTPDDTNSVVIYGPDGVILRDLNKKTVVTLTVNGVTFDLQAGDAVTIEGNLIVSGNIQLGGAIQALAGGTYTGAIQTAGNVIAGAGTADQVGLQTHTHTQPNDSHGDSEGPTSAPTAGT